MRVLIIDNYDSFTFNLYQYVGEILSSSHLRDFEVLVKRNDDITLDEIRALNPTHIIISPGPGTPEDKEYFGICGDVIMQLGKTIPTMGVCLGMQGIAQCFGGKIVRSPVPMHGKVSVIDHDGRGLYSNMPQDIEVMRYHSLMIDPETLPKCLEATSFVKEGREIMGVRHRQYPIEGIQFHPESFATEGGQSLLKNFVSI